MSLLSTPAPTLPTPTVRQEPPEATAEAATRWAELHNTDHLTRARGEEARRKTRFEERSSLLARIDKPRSLNSPAPKH